LEFASPTSRWLAMPRSGCPASPMGAVSTQNLDPGPTVDFSVCSGNIDAARPPPLIVASLPSRLIPFGPEDWFWSGSGKV
jgi:hypothetical protein